MRGELKQMMAPGILTSQVWPEAVRREGETLRGLETLVATGFFEALQCLNVPFAAERRAIARLVEQTGMRLNFGLARLVYDQGHNLAALEEARRRQAVAAFTEQLAPACETGAAFVQLISGAAPQDPRQRPESLKRLADSLREIAAQAAALNPALRVTIEPMDVAAHKKGALGTTPEAIELVRQVSADTAPVGLVLDTAHLILNQEDPAAMLETALEHVVEFHLCNCVTDAGHPLYGDHHLHFGAPGVLDVPQLGGILARAIKVGYCSATRRGRVFLEVRIQDPETPGTLIDACREVFEGSWAAAWTTDA